MPGNRKGLIRMAPRMAPNARIRLIPLLLLCMSGASLAESLPPLKVSPDLLRGVRVAPVKAPAPSAAPATAENSPIAPRAPVVDRALPAAERAPAAPATQAPQAPQAPQATQAAPLPVGTTAISALRIHGSRSIELVAEGDAELQRDDTVLTADKVTYREPTDEVVAEGNVVLSRGTDTIRGPQATLVVGDQTGRFESPQYQLSRARGPVLAGDAPRSVSGSGEADVLNLEGENQYSLKNATWTTCSPTDPDWYSKARELELDYDREVGTAHGASIVFMDTPIFWMPWAEFPLNGQRQSGFLPPTFGSSNKTGVDFTQPYYWNIAPNYDATVAPRIMSRRGLQVGGEVRYLGEDYQGTTRVEWMPEDKVTGEE